MEPSNPAGPCNPCIASLAQNWLSGALGHVCPGLVIFQSGGSSGGQYGSAPPNPVGNAQIAIQLAPVGA